MVMLKNNQAGIGGIGRGGAKGLIEDGRSADSLDAEITIASFGTERAGIKIYAIGLAGGGGEGLGKNASFGLKSGGVGRGGGAFGGFGDDGSAGHGPGGDGIINAIGGGFEIAVRDKILSLGRKAGDESDGRAQKNKFEFHFGCYGKTWFCSETQIIMI
jgi:hypothetical protein